MATPRFKSRSGPADRAAVADAGVPLDLGEAIRVPGPPALAWGDACAHAVQMLDAKHAFGAGIDRAEVVLAIGRTIDPATSFEHEWLDSVHRLSAPMIARQVESTPREARRTAYRPLELGFAR